MFCNRVFRSTKLNTWEWYNKRVYPLDQEQGYDCSDISAAFNKSREWGDRIPLGIIYRNEKPCFEEKNGLNSLKPLVEYEPDEINFEEIMKQFA